MTKRQRRSNLKKKPGQDGGGNNSSARRLTPQAVTRLLLAGTAGLAVGAIAMAGWANAIVRHVGNHVSLVDPGNRLILPRDIGPGDVWAWPGDVFFKTLYHKLEEKNFRTWTPEKLAEDTSSEAVVAAASRVPSLATATQGKVYESLYDLMQDMLRAGRFDDEKAAFLAYSAEDGVRRDFGLSYAEHYLQSVYLDPALSYLASGQPGRARWCVRRALALAEMMNLGTSGRMSHVWLLAALLEDPALAFEFPEETQRIAHAAANYLPGVINLPSDLPDFRFWQEYTRGLAEFRAGRFAEAWQRFFAAESATSRARLDDLALLMQARSLFWACDRRNVSGSNSVDIAAFGKLGYLDNLSSPPYTAVDTLESLRLRIANETLQRDVKTYADMLRAQ